MEAEARLILANALKDDKQSNIGLGSKIAHRFSGKGLEIALPEFHGEEINAVELKNAKALFPIFYIS